jgi:hypothetical protein
MVAYGLPFSSGSGTKRSRLAVMSAALMMSFTATAAQAPPPVVSYSSSPSVASVVICTSASGVPSVSL